MKLDDKISVSVEEAAKLLGVSRPTIYKLIHRGDFPFFKIEGRTMIHKAKLEQWADAQLLSEPKMRGWSNDAKNEDD